MQSTISAKNLFLKKFSKMSEEEFDLFARAILEGEEGDPETILKRAVTAHSDENIAIIIYYASCRKAA